MKYKITKIMAFILLVVIAINNINIVAYGQEQKQYYYFLYNGKAVTNEDLKAIQDYTNKFDKEKVQCILKDTAGMNEYTIYAYLKQQPRIDAIQIFGTAQDVPAFKIKHNIVIKSGVEELFGISQNGSNAYFDTDYFYNNLTNDPKAITNFTLKNYGYERVKIDLTPKIKVVRLPLTKGDYAAYLKKYDTYISSHPGVLPLTSFYDSAFGSHPASIDNINYFIQGNLDYEGKIIDSSMYKLFGQKEFYDMQLGTSGTYTKENMEKMNKERMQHFIFTGHGDKNGFLYQSRSELNSKNVNTVLGTNFYNMNAISCNNAEGMNNENFVYQMLKGKGIYVMALTDFYYHGDLFFQKDMDYTYEDDNFRYFYYEYYKNLYSGMNVTDSFYKAQEAYVARVHQKPIKSISQCQLANLIFCHNFGVLEYKQIEKPYVYKDILSEKQKENFIDFDKKITKEIKEWTANEEILQKEVQKKMAKAQKFTFYKSSGEDLYAPSEGIKINKIEAKRIDNELLVNIDFDSTQRGRIILRSKGPNVYLHDFEPGNNKIEMPIQLQFLFEFDASIDLFYPGEWNAKENKMEGVNNHFIAIRVE